MGRGVAVLSSDDKSDLGKHLLGHFLGSGHKREGSYSLSIKTEVLGERLNHHHLEAVFQEDLHGFGIFGQVTGGVSLIGRVKEREKLLLLENLSQLDPLFSSGINSGGVVGTGVKNHNGAGGSLVKAVFHSLKVKSFGFREEIGVFRGLQTSIFDDIQMVRPGRVRDEDMPRHESSNEIETDSQASGSTQALHSGDFAFLNQGVGLSEHQLSGKDDEGVKSVHSQVLFIEFSFLGFVSKDVGSFSHTLEYIRLFVIVPVGADSQVHLLWVFVSFVSQGSPQNRVGRGQGEMLEKISII